MKTGEQYIGSLSDGRHAYIDGRQNKELVDDRTTRAAESLVASVYDKFYSAESRATNSCLTPPTTSSQLRDVMKLVRGVEMLARNTFTSVMTLLMVLPQLQETYPELARRVRTHLKFVADNDLRVTEAIADANGLRALPPGKRANTETYVMVVESRSDGLVIRGAKLHVTGASLAHELFVMPTKKMRPGEETFAIAGAVPANAPEVTTINAIYTSRGDDDRHFPFARQRQMSNSFVIFDDVFIPNEPIFVNDYIAFSAIFARSHDWWERLEGMAEMAHDADILVELAQLVAEANDLYTVAHVKEKISEFVLFATLIRAGLDAAIANSHSTRDGFVYPDERITNGAKHRGGAEFSVMARHLIKIAGGSVLTASTIGALEVPELEGHIRGYMTGIPDVSGEERLRPMHAIRDMVADAFGDWHYVTSVHAGGGLYAQRIGTRNHYPMDEVVEMVRDTIGLDVG